MYIVLSSQNSLDTSVPDVAPRIVTDEIEDALRCARGTFKDRHAPFVAKTFIFRMAPGQLYGVNNTKTRDGEDPLIVAYMGWEHPTEDGRLVELFFDEKLANLAGVEVYVPA